MSVIFRRGTIDDSYTVFRVFQESVLDLAHRQGTVDSSGGIDPIVDDNLWIRRQPFFEHLARTADQFWIAEQNTRVVGYARSIWRDNVRELTEFFVLPEAQSAGIGGELLRRAFPREGAKNRVIIATTDVRAQARYLKTGVVPRFPEMYWFRPPENVRVESDLEFERAVHAPETLAQLANIDRAILGHTRDIDHAWLLESSEGYLYKRDGMVVGYGYLAAGCGPVAVLEARDFNAVLAHAEATAFARGHGQVGFDIPMINRAAIDYFLAHNYKLDPFVAFLMSDTSFGKFENYVLTSPPFIL